MYQYRLYGLNVSSSRKINLLTEEHFAHADLEVEWFVSNEETPDRKADWKRVSTEFLDQIENISLWESDFENKKLTNVRFSIETEQNINFLTDESRRRLQIYHDETLAENDLDSLFVGPVLGFTLRLREIVCLHSSVVGINGKAIAFLGHSSSGKSTIAAALAEAGAEILSDDIAVLQQDAAGFLVQAGYSKVRLRPKAAEFFSENPASLPIVYTSRESRYFSLEETGIFHSGPLPLAAIYLLGEISDDYLEPFVRPASSHEKLLDLIKNTSGSYVVTGKLRAAEFEVLSKIATTIPIRRLHYAHDVKTLPRQCEIILEDFQSLIGSD